MPINTQGLASMIFFTAFDLIFKILGSFSRTSVSPITAKSSIFADELLTRFLPKHDVLLLKKI